MTEKRLRVQAAKNEAPKPAETLQAFTRRHEIPALAQMFAESAV
jgi:hypothetical protein